MRYYLDTNLLIFILQNEDDNISYKLKELLKDYSNSLLVSSVVVEELLFLLRIGKLSKITPFKKEVDYLSAISELRISIEYFNKNHFFVYSKLNLANNHKDMNDHLIISQAISDKIPLISSDSKFEEYSSQGLKFIYNKR